MTKKTRLIPFNYDLYKAGAKAVFRNDDSEIAYILKSKFNEKYAICVLYYYDDALHADFRDKYGGLVAKTEKSDCDLMLEEQLEEKTFYVNIYSGGMEPYHYKSLEDAQETVRKDNDFYQGTLKVTYTDEDLIK